MERKERGREVGEVKGGRRNGRDRAPKLLLNQGPSEPCYATDGKSKNFHASSLFNVKSYSIGMSNSVWCEKTRMMLIPVGVKGISYYIQLHLF